MCNLYFKSAVMFTSINRNWMTYLLSYRYMVESPIIVFGWLSDKPDKNDTKQKLHTLPAFWTTSCFEYSMRWGISPIQSPVFSFEVEQCLRRKTHNFEWKWEWWRWGKILNENGVLFWSYTGCAAPYCGRTIWGKQLLKTLLTSFHETDILQFVMFCMSVLGQSQRQWGTPPEMKIIPLCS